MSTMVHEGKRFYLKHAPKIMNGKELHLEEIHRSNCPMATIQQAEKVLELTRAFHREKYGWVELDAWIEHYTEGYISVCFLAQYK